ncbi:MAG: sigma-54-dependent transcriptional regulator [Vicinamibacterales bacterium]
MADPTPHVLFIDDEAALRTLMAERLRERGFDVIEAENGEAALDLLEQFAFDIVITDLRMPGIDGGRVVESAVGRYPGIIGIVITGYGTVKDAVDAIKRGATDFIAKPFQFDELMHVLRKALEQRRLAAENAYLRSQLEERYQFGGILGRSRPMQTLFQLLETVARTSSTLLIAGETGTGKEVVARAIHHNSPRRPHRFVALNCSAIPESLLEAELFGHVRGAFTGAVGMREGRFEQAHKGTLFLDEVGTTSPALQVKLLRALQEREFERVGDNQTIKVDVRVIAATNTDLARMVTAGTFREDLFYRLNVIPIHLPPLRERRDDIPLLVKHFLSKFAPGTSAHVSQSAMRALMAYHWPGNVRQLENAVERAIALCAGRQEITVTDLPPEVQSVPEADALSFVDFPDDGLDLPRYLASVERDLIHRALDRTQGNRNKAADLLRIKRTTLVEKLKRIGAHR